MGKRKAVYGLSVLLGDVCTLRILNMVMQVDIPVIKFYFYPMSRRFILIFTVIALAIIIWGTRSAMKRARAIEQAAGGQASAIKDTSPTSRDSMLTAPHPRMTKLYDSTKIENHHPFIIYHDGSFLVAAEIEAPELLEEYQPVFDKYGLSGNGYCWEGVIRQILQQQKPALLKQIEFDPEAGGFYVYADGPQSQREFAVFLSKIFSDHVQLHQYLKTVDRSLFFD